MRQIPQEDVKNYLIDCVGYSEEDVQDFQDPTSIYAGRLQEVLTDKQWDEFLEFAYAEHKARKENEYINNKEGK